MRAISENKAGGAVERCPHCGRGVGDAVGKCRPTRDGDHWWCWSRMAIIFDPAKLIAPAPEPLSESEQAAVDEYAPRIAEAEAAVDQAMVIAAVIEREYREAAMAAVEVGVTEIGGAFRAIDPSRIRQARNGERQRLRRVAEKAQKRHRKAQEKLQAARRELIRLNALCDRARRTGRARDEEAERRVREDAFVI